jgi:hypothetical protein
VSARTQPTDEPGKNLANTSGYRARSARLERVARTTHTPHTSYGRSPPMAMASSAASESLRWNERAPAPMSRIEFQAS